LGEWVNAKGRRDPKNGLKYLKRKEKSKAIYRAGEHCKKSYKTSFAMGLGGS
jgi:hypothetical protein